MDNHPIDTLLYQDSTPGVSLVSCMGRTPLREGPTLHHTTTHQGAGCGSGSVKSCFYEPAHSPLHRGVARGTSTLPCARGRGAPRGRSSACGVASRRASHCASEQEPVRGGGGGGGWSGVQPLTGRLAARLSRPAHAPAAIWRHAVGSRHWAAAAAEPRRPGGRGGEPHLSTGGAHRARASGTPPTPPTAGVRPPPRRRRPRRAPRDAPPPRRARTPRCTPAPTHMHMHARVTRSRRAGGGGAEEADVKRVRVLRGRGYPRGWRLVRDGGGRGDGTWRRRRGLGGG